LADPFGLDGVDHLHRLLVEFDQLGASLPEPPVGLGPLLEGFEFSRLGGDVLRPRTAAIRKDLGLMEVAPGASAVGLSATSPGDIDGSGQQSISLKKDLCELCHALCELAQFSVAGTESGGHVSSPEARGGGVLYLSVIIYI
jgi:hypothetical protein